MRHFTPGFLTIPYWLISTYIRVRDFDAYLIMILLFARLWSGRYLLPFSFSRQRLLLIVQS